MIVRNELVRGESGWSTFEEREANAMMNCFVRMILNKNIVAEIGVSCLLEISLSVRDTDFITLNVIELMMQAQY